MSSGYDVGIRYQEDRATYASFRDIRVVQVDSAIRKRVILYDGINRKCGIKVLEMSLSFGGKLLGRSTK